MKMASLLKAGQCAAIWCAGIGFGMSPAVPVVMADGNSQGDGKDKIRPSELPIYEEPEDLYDISYHISGKGQVQEGVEVVRKEISGMVDATKEFRQQLDHYYQTGRAHTAALLYTLMETVPLDRELTYLREEENVVARVGAIATGGVLGLLVARRRGFFRKIFYTSTGAGATAALLYPQHARHYTQEAVVNAGTYITVAYNFLIGVKPNGTKAPPSAASPADDSGKSASGSRGVVEVSNPYPALLTLPYTRQFRKQHAVHPQLFGHRSGRQSTPEQITEEVSQVATLGFRLLDRNDTDDNALEGFGSVSVTVSNKCEKCGKVKVSAADGSTVELKSEVKEEASKAYKEHHVSQVAYLADKAAVVINELERIAEKIENVSEKLESVAKVVETVSEAVADAAAETAPLIGDQLEMVAEGIETDAKIGEAIFSETKQMAGKVEDVLESVEVVVNTFKESTEEVKEVPELVQNGKEQKHPLLSKIFSFFSTDPKTPAPSSQTAATLVNDVTPATEAVVPQETDISVNDTHKNSLKNSHEKVQVITGTKIESLPEKESPAALSVTHSDQDVIVSAGPSNVVLLPPEATLPPDSFSTSLLTSRIIRDTRTVTTEPPAVAIVEPPAIAIAEPPAVASTDAAIRVQHRRGFMVVEAPGTSANTLDPSLLPPPYASAATTSHCPPSESDIEAKVSPAPKAAEEKVAAEKDLLVKAALEAARKEGVEGDRGQSHPDDADMYTTRS